MGCSLQAANSVVISTATKTGTPLAGSEIRPAAQRERAGDIGFWLKMRSAGEGSEGVGCTHGRMAEPNSLSLSVRLRNVDADFSQFVVARRSSN
jgi:hypothetical protein